MSKFCVMLIVLGVNNIFADLTTIQNFDESLLPENKDTTILKIESYNSEKESGNETNEILKASMDEDVGDEVNVIIKELNTAEGSSDHFGHEPNYEKSLSYDTNVGEPQTEKSDVTNNLNWSGLFNADDDYESMKESDFSYKDLMTNDPNEIMETAAGFVPIPILKRRQKPRKQFANRRLFRRPYPYRRFYIYPYYRYYYPGSLRFY